MKSRNVKIIQPDELKIYINPTSQDKTISPWRLIKMISQDNAAAVYRFFIKEETAHEALCWIYWLACQAIFWKKLKALIISVNPNVCMILVGQFKYLVTGIFKSVHNIHVWYRS